MRPKHILYYFEVFLILVKLIVLLHFCGFIIKYFTLKNCVEFYKLTIILKIYQVYIKKSSFYVSIHQCWFVITGKLIFNLMRQYPKAAKRR